MTYRNDSSQQILSAEALENLAKPRFRVVLTPAGRKGLRLEDQFWTSLSDLAKDQGIKKTNLISSILAQSTEANATRALRCYVAHAQAEQIAHLKEHVDPKVVIRMLLKVPMPAFVIDKNKALQEVNAEFIQMLRITAGGVTPHPPTDLVQLTLDTPVETLFSKLKSADDHAECGYVLQVATRQRRGRARAVGIRSEELQVLVGYILS